MLYSSLSYFPYYLTFLGVCVIRWVSNGDFVSDADRDIYIEREKKERGVGLMGDNDITKCVQRYFLTEFF